MQAAYFDPSIMGTIRKAIDNNKIYPQWQAVLNKVYQ
jgi:hypothetical protein